MKLTTKQTKALDFLEDNTTNEVLFGGSAGPGKSALGCYWQLKKRLKYPGSRGLIGRAQMKTLKETTLQTFFDIAKKQGIIRGSHFDLTSSQDKESPNCLVFYNSSKIYLRDLYLYPSDPEFDDLGSLEISDAFVDECSQVTDKAITILKTRIRYGFNEFGFIRKILYATNPTKNWLYYNFYQPHKEGKLPFNKKFIPALVTDNPHAPKSYIEDLRNMPEGPEKARLYYGDWEYSADPSALISYENILNCFTNSFVSPGVSYITCDIARFGADSTVIVIWNGFRCRIEQYRGFSIRETVEKIGKIQNELKIPNSRVLIDEDGVGGGAVDHISGCKGFVNNSVPLPNPLKPLEKENYANLKSQCYFRLAERINKGELFIDCNNTTQKAAIIQELEQVKMYNMDKDGKKQILPKDKVKELIGRSPDFSDALMMREWFELSPKMSWVAF